MKSIKLTADIFILAIAMIWPVVHAYECDDLGFQKLRHTYMREPGEFESQSMSEHDCKEMCVQEDGCSGVDWNSEDSMCSIHLVQRLYETAESVTHYHKCENGLLPLSAEPLTAGFPAIDRDHIYRLTYEDMDDNPLPAEIPIIIMQPPATSPASFSKAGVGNIEIYIKATTYSAFTAYVGIARPKGDPLKDGFEFISRATFSPSWNMGFPYEDKIELSPSFAVNPNKPVEAQPGDAIYVHLGSMPSDFYGIVYDIGTPEECGITYKGALQIPSWTMDPSSLTALDECWMMSASISLTPQN